MRTHMHMTIHKILTHSWLVLERQYMKHKKSLLCWFLFDLVLAWDLKTKTVLGRLLIQEISVLKLACRACQRFLNSRNRIY